MSDTKQPLLLHACCAPCATHVIEQLSRSFSVTAFFYNPNIQPDDEYQLRLQAMRRLCRLTNTQLLVEACPVSEDIDSLIADDGSSVDDIDLEEDLRKLEEKSGP